SAAESVLHGGPGLLLGAGGSAALRAAGAYSLLETSASMGWRVALELERRLAERTALVGVSLVLNQPLYTGAARGYPYDPESFDRIARSPFRRGFAVLPGFARDRGTVILLNRFTRHFAHPTQQPYRAIFQALRTGPREPEELTEAERLASEDPRAVADYRNGRTCHPLLPFADWAGCAPAVGRLGTVLLAGCRAAVAARKLGFVPTHGIGAALEMARGRHGDEPRIGFLLSRPYFPIRVTV